MAVVSGYSSAQMLAMQKDAIRRVNEMQRQAQERLRQTQSLLQEPDAPPEEVPAQEPAPSLEPKETAPPAQPQETAAPEESGNPFQGIFQRLGLDEESVLLLLLLLLLVNEGADSKLILALVYILL